MTGVRLVGPSLAVLGSGPGHEVVAALADALADDDVTTVVGDIPPDWEAALSAITAAISPGRAIRLAISGAGEGSVPPALALATSRSFPVEASPGPVIALPDGRLFAPGGWCWFAAGYTRPTPPSGRRYPPPLWEPELDEFAMNTPSPGLRVLPTPAGLWVTHTAAPAPRLDDPVIGTPTDDDRALVVVGGPTGPDPDPRAVADLIAQVDVPLRVISYGGQEIDLGPRPEDDPTSPWWVDNGLVQEVGVGYDTDAARFVVDGNHLTPGALGERIAADAAWRGRPVLLRQAGEAPGWAVQAVADQLHAPVVIRTMPAGWRAHRYRVIGRGSPVPIDMADVDTVDDLVTLMATEPTAWVPPPAPTVQIELRPGDVIELARADHPIRPFVWRGTALSAWELAVCLTPLPPDVTELFVRADQATEDELRLLAVFLEIPVVASDGSRHEPRGRNADRPPPEPATEPAPPPVAEHVAGPMAPAAKLREFESFPSVSLTPPPKPGQARPVPAPQPPSDVPQAVPPVLPAFEAPDTASTPEHHQVLRKVLGWRYDVYLRQVTRTLAQRPGMRADTMNPDGAVPDLVAVTALLNDDESIFLDALRAQPRDEVSEALLVCLCGGLRRLPRQLGLTYAAASGDDALFRGGGVLADRGLLAGSTSVRDLFGDDVELVIWSTTGRRVGGFAGESTRGLVLFPPGTPLVVLGTEGEVQPTRVYLAEHKLAGADPGQGKRLLSRLRSAPAGVRSSAQGAARSPALVTVTRAVGSTTVEPTPALRLTSTVAG